MVLEHIAALPLQDSSKYPYKKPYHGILATASGGYQMALGGST